MEKIYIMGLTDGTAHEFESYEDLILGIKHFHDEERLDEISDNGIQLIMFDPKKYAIGVHFGEMYAYRCINPGQEDQEDIDVLNELGMGVLPFDECLLHILDKNILLDNVIGVCR